MAEHDGVFVLRDTLLRAADLYGSAPAVACGERQHTWADLARRTCRLANRLAEEGVGRGDRVVLVSGNRLEVAEAAFAVTALGAVLVPLSPLAAREEIAWVRGDAAAAIGLVHADVADLADPGAGRWITVGDDRYERALAACPDDEPPLVERPDDVALQFYTSGTTGRQKGVLMSHAALVVNGLNTILSQGIAHEDVFLTCTPVTHAAGGTRIFTLATEGIAHVILERWSASAFFAEVARRRATVTVLVPTMLRDVVRAPGLTAADLSSLRLIVYGAAPTPPDVQRAALERLDAGLLHSYGISEGCPALTALTPDEHVRAAADPALAHRLESVGRPVPGVRVRIVGDDGGRLPPGEAGEIQVRNAKRMAGYWHRAEEEAAVWRDGWMATGDLGHVDADGYLTILGRRTDMIISGGLNVYPAEIERVLLAHDAVREAAVVGVPDERFGETPVAFVVTGGEVTDEDLHALCRARLARYKQPASLHRLDALPRNETGKVVKHELAALVSATAR